MAKRLIVCCDGTWNTPDQKEDGHICPTNVVKMASAIAPLAPDGTAQIVLYHDGVGASSGLDLSHWAGGAFGVGLSKIIQDGYRFLVDNYTDGDELYFFGFSRGAYAARSLCGLLRNSGLLQKIHADKIPDAYGLYRRADPASLPQGEEATEFRRQFSREVPIKCVGVWDTVGALGIPDHILRRLTDNLWEFHDVKLSRIVEHAYQALAIDEKREDFQPTLWEQQPDAVNQHLEQVWFAGVHCNVGGGYVDSELSDVAFLWMQQKVAACGLAFDAEFIKTKIQPNPTGVLRDSKTGLFHLRADYIRPIGQGKNAKEYVHQSVIDRSHADPAYHPTNLQAYLAAGGPLTSTAQGSARRL
jgi:uncharacterized protein (DUF2235 family)